MITIVMTCMFKGEAGKKPWEARTDRIDKKEFEEARRCLLNSYHSYVQNHAGYVIALVIGLLALISNYDSFLKTGSVIVFGFFCFFIMLIVGAFFYMVRRIQYWTSFADLALCLTLDDVILFFNYRNSTWPNPYLTEAPHLAILQLAIYQRLRIGDPNMLVFADGWQGLKYWILGTRRKEMDKLIEQAKEGIHAEQWTKAKRTRDKLEIANIIASALKDKAKKDEIEKLKKEMPN